MAKLFIKTTNDNIAYRMNYNAAFEICGSVDDLLYTEVMGMKDISIYKINSAPTAIIALREQSARYIILRLITTIMGRMRTGSPELRALSQTIAKSFCMSKVAHDKMAEDYQEDFWSFVSISANLWPCMDVDVSKLDNEEKELIDALITIASITKTLEYRAQYHAERRYLGLLYADRKS